MSPEIFHSIILILTIAFSFSLVKTQFYQYDLQITALIFIVYFLAKKISKEIPRRPRQLAGPPRNDKEGTRLLDSIIFTLIILNIVNSTGATKSPLFFLNYFLIFALSLLLEPIISITTTLTLVIFYLLSLPENQSIKELLPIFSLPFLTPFAMFLGQEYMENQKLKVKSQKLEEDNFLFLSLVIKKHLQNIKEAVTNFMGDHELDIIKKSTNRMEHLIDKFEKSSK
jgi:hypothetical protein